MDNQLYENMCSNTITNEFCLNSINNDPKQEYNIVRDGQYLTELHLTLDCVHNEINAYPSEAEIVQQREEMIYEDPGHGNPDPR